MNARIPVLLFSLLLLPAAPAADPEPALNKGAVEFNFKLAEPERTLASSAVDCDRSAYNSCSPTATLRQPDGTLWTVAANLDFPGEGREGQLQLTVDELRPFPVAAEGAPLTQPVRIFSVFRAYRGPGTYRLFRDGEKQMTVTIREDIAVVPRNAPPVATPQQR